MIDKQSVYDVNIKVLKWIATLMNAPLYFFVVIYFYEITDSYFFVSSLLIIGNITQTLMEVPTGILSDKFLGRRGTYIAGSLCFFLCFVLYALGAINYLFLIPARIFFGLAHSFNSGNTNALFYDTLRDGGREKEFSATLSRYHSYGYIYGAASLLIAGFLAHYLGTIFVIYYCILHRLATVVLGIMLKEPVSHKEDRKTYNLNVLQHMGEALSSIAKDKLLFLLSLIKISRWVFVLSLVRFNSTFYELFIPLNWLGIITSISLIVHAIVAKYSQKVALKLGTFKTLLFVEYFSIPLQLLAYVFPGVASPALLETSMQANPLTNIIEDALLHKNFTNEQRATMESLITIISMIFFTVATLAIGYLADRIGLGNALLIFVSLRLIIMPTLLYLGKKTLTSN